LNNTILAEGHGWRERSKARWGAELRTNFVALGPGPFKVDAARSRKERISKFERSAIRIYIDPNAAIGAPLIQTGKSEQETNKLC
jgi:hypothetical protein